MKYYRQYMDAQTMSDTGHARLLALAENPPVRAAEGPSRSPRPWAKFTALAACCVLAAGLGLGRLLPAPAPEQPDRSAGQSAASPDADAPGESSASASADADPYSFTVQSGIDDKAVMEGSFSVDLTADQIREIFWGPDGKPTPEHPKAERGDLPWILLWDGYTVSASALYDGGGNLYEVTVHGEHPNGGTFTLSLAPDRLPFRCGLYSDVAVTDVRGIEVTGWRLENTCVSELLSGAVGARFENTGGPFRTDAGAGRDEASAAQRFNALFVNWATYEDCPLTLDHLLKAEHVPEWRAADFTSLEEARQEADFAPWLPAEAPAGFGDFRGRLTYQEGNEHVLWVRWSRGYDDVSVCVRLPEGDERYETVDVSNPAAYDMRLYDIPWSETVPEEYRDGFFSVACFRAEDMSPEVVRARGSEKDTGGMHYSFGVLHPDGTLVEYDCSGVTAEYVWGLVEGTL